MSTRSRRPAAHRRAVSAEARPDSRSRLPDPLGRPADPQRAVEILSHELRSPITTIHLGTQVLRDAGPRIPAPVRGEVVAAVAAETDRLAWLVEDLLAVARHADPAVRLPARPLLLQHWLPEATGAALRDDPALRIRSAVPADLPPVLADDNALAQVLRNLLRNVARHARDGLPAELVAHPPEDGMVAIDVLDRGPGVDPAEAERLFEPFYRSAAAEASGSGAGLGLAAAQRLARAMGGDVTAAARAGGGTRVTVRLRVANPDDDAEPEAGAVTP